MKQAISLAIFLLTSCVVAAPVTDDDKIVVTEDFFPDSLAIHTAEHEIVHIYVPLNSLNFDDDDDETDNDEEVTQPILFFVLADKEENGQINEQGLYVLKNNVSIKLLDHGRGATADNGDNKVVYFGAQDGLYIYDAEKNEAVKYGTITDNITKLAKANGTDMLYILTEDGHVYKITDEGSTKSEISLSEGVKDIVLDYSNNLYVLTENYEIISFNGENKIVIDIPSSAGQKKTFIRPPFILDDSILCVVDDTVYIAYSNGTHEDTDFVLKVKPTAYAMDATLIQYYAYNKKIYEYNVLAILLEGVFEALQSFFEDKKDEIQSIATRSRSDLRA